MRKKVYSKSVELVSLFCIKLLECGNRSGIYLTILSRALCKLEGRRTCTEKFSKALINCSSKHTKEFQGRKFQPWRRQLKKLWARVRKIFQMEFHEFNIDRTLRRKIFTSPLQLCATLRWFNIQMHSEQIYIFQQRCGLFCNSNDQNSAFETRFLWLREETHYTVKKLWYIRWNKICLLSWKRKGTELFVRYLPSILMVKP